MPHTKRLLKVVVYERSGNLKQKTFINKTDEEIKETMLTKHNVSTVTLIDTYELINSKKVA